MIRSKAATKQYRANFDQVFTKKSVSSCKHAFVIWDPAVPKALCTRCGAEADSVEKLRK